MSKIKIDLWFECIIINFRLNILTNDLDQTKYMSQLVYQVQVLIFDIKIVLVFTHNKRAQIRKRIKSNNLSQCEATTTTTSLRLTYINKDVKPLSRKNYNTLNSPI